MGTTEDLLHKDTVALARITSLMLISDVKANQNRSKAKAFPATNLSAELKNKEYTHFTFVCTQVTKNIRMIDSLGSFCPE